VRPANVSPDLVTPSVHATARWLWLPLRVRFCGELLSTY
jgi:hypothetical protein